MNVVQFLEYLTEHDASRELGAALSDLYAQRSASKAASARTAGASLATASPTAA